MGIATKISDGESEEPEKAPKAPPPEAKPPREVHTEHREIIEHVHTVEHRIPETEVNYLVVGEMQGGSILRPEDPLYIQVKANRQLTPQQAIARSSTAYYDSLAYYYNRMVPVGCMLLCDIRKRKIQLSNFKKTLENRGLVYGTDFICETVVKDANGQKIPPSKRPTAITKKTTNGMRMIGSRVIMFPELEKYTDDLLALRKQSTDVQDALPVPDIQKLTDDGKAVLLTAKDFEEFANSDDFDPDEVPSTNPDEDVKIDSDLEPEEAGPSSQEAESSDESGYMDPRSIS